MVRRQAGTVQGLGMEELAASKMHCGGMGPGRDGLGAGGHDSVAWVEGAKMELVAFLEMLHVNGVAL